MNTGDLPTQAQGNEQPIRYVLFVCNHNAGRSQMAQAFFECYGPEDVHAESAGTDPAPEIWPMVEAWDIPDPAGRPIEDVRAIRDGIQDQVRELIAVRLQAIRSDRTAHEMRLARLLPTLAEEFATTRSPEEIRACADAVLEGFDGARIRSHVLTLAHSETRECLRRDTCDLIPASEGS